MARTLQQRAAELKALDPATPASLEKYRAAAQATTGFLVAVVAVIVGEHRLDALIPELVLAFVRLCEDGAKRDPACRGKLAIARALHELDHWDDKVFVAGLSYLQQEGWGAEDTAVELRGVCGLAHAHFGRPDALDVLAELLHDPQRTVRIAAAQGLGDTGRPDASALLRFKVMLGDAEGEVLAACLESMFSLARESTCEFAIKLLRGHDERAEVAALALGGARITDAVDALTSWCIGAPTEQRHRVGYLALALLRADAATAYLLDAVRSHGKLDALAAGRALATFRDDPGLADQAREAAQHQQDRATRDELVRLFA